MVGVSKQPLVEQFQLTVPAGDDRKRALIFEATQCSKYRCLWHTSAVGGGAKRDAKRFFS